MVIYSSVTYNDQLPERTHLPLLTIDEIKAILTHLWEAYNPPVRGTRIVSHRKIFPPPQDNSLGSAIHLRPPLPQAKRPQPSSRKPACDWLTALISHLQKRLLKGGDDLEANEGLLDDAAALLAIFAGTASAGKLTRTFTFDHNRDPLSPPVHVEVTDIPLENQDYTTLGAQTWGGAHVLAEIIIQNPDRFGLHPGWQRPKILELGAGTGLVSLAAYRYLASRGLGATIYATDFNTLILNNLAHNISINKLAMPESNTDLKISSDSLDWSNPDAANTDLFNSVDLVLGADVIYEELHAHWIRTCVEKFMRKPRPGSVQPMFHLVIPLRPTHTFESSTIEGIFPLRSETSGQHGWELVVFSKDFILCEASDDEADGQVEYVYYSIGWESKTPEQEHHK
jgi:predicted nicotinamide N-methyase